VRKALTTIVAAAGLVVLVVPAAEATLDRSLPMTHSHGKAAKVAKASPKAKRGGVPSSILAPSAVICPELAPGDNGGYCLLVPSANDRAGT
jgi:hypothetical protein